MPQIFYVFSSRVLASCIYFGFLPFLVYYISKVHGYPYGYGVGFLICVSIFSDIIKLSAGRFLGKYSARNIIICTLGVLSITMWAFHYAIVLPAYFVFVIGMIVGGCFGVFYVFFRVIFSNLGTNESAVRYHSYMGSANNIGMVVGPLIFATFLKMEKIENIFLVFCILAILSLCFMCFVLEKKTKIFPAQVGVSHKRLLLYVFVMNAIYWALLQQIVLNLVVYYKDYFNNVTTGAYFFSVQAIMAALLLPIISRKFEKYNPLSLYKTFIIGGIIMSIGYVTAGLSNNVWIFTISLAILLTLGEAFSLPTINAVVTKTASGSQELGKAFGFLGLTQGIGIIIGHSIGGIIYLQMINKYSANLYWIVIGSLGVLLFICSSLFLSDKKILNVKMRKHF